jgi:alpha-L-fucosidase
MTALASTGLSLLSRWISTVAWQTDTCVGEWNYNRSIFDRRRYKTVAQVVRSLINIVSKNGTLLLSIPVRADGTIDPDEVAFLEGMAKWMEVNGEGIFGTRPWKTFGEGPARSGGGMFSEGRTNYASQDIRFTVKGDTLYAFLLSIPTEPRALIKTLATNSPQMAGKKVTDVSLVGYSGKLKWNQDDQGLAVQLPEKTPSEHTVALRIRGA